MDVSAEVSKLQAAYDLAVEHREKAKKDMARAIREQQVIKWELEHQKRRNKDYEKVADKLLMEIAVLKSHFPMIGERSLFGSSNYTCKKCIYIYMCNFTEISPIVLWHTVLLYNYCIITVLTFHYQIAVALQVNSLMTSCFYFLH